MLVADDLFEWAVARDGYSWFETSVEVGPGCRKKQWCLAEIGDGSATIPTRTYRPFHDSSGLFLTFANTDPTRDGVLGFVGRFGRLARRSPVRAAPVRDEAGRLVMPTDECLGEWQSQIGDMAKAARLWHMWRIGDTENFAARIRWTRDSAGQDAVSYVTGPEDDDVDRISSRTFHPERLGWLRPGDVVLPALLYAQDQINVRIESLASPRLVWDTSRTRMELRLVPDTLVGALWLQFAAAVAADKGFRRCGQCDAWFALAPAGGRSTKQFCSGACRTRAHRARQETAGELHRQGKSLREIAEQVETDLSTVRKWVKQLKD
jgi:hypothetical protein